MLENKKASLQSELEKRKAKVKTLNDKYVELRINNIDNFKLDFNKIKNELNLKTYITIDNIIILEKL